MKSRWSAIEIILVVAIGLILLAVIIPNIPKKEEVVKSYDMREGGIAIEGKVVVATWVRQNLKNGWSVEKIGYIAPEYNNYGDYTSFFVQLYKVGMPWVTTCGDVWVNNKTGVIEKCEIQGYKWRQNHNVL